MAHKIQLLWRFLSLAVAMLALLGFIHIAVERYHAYQKCAHKFIEEQVQIANYLSEKNQKHAKTTEPGLTLSVEILGNYIINQYDGRKLQISSTFEVSGLGNLMFQYASLLGIAQHYQMVPTISSELKLRQLYNLSAIALNETRPGLKWGKVLEKKSCSYEERIMTMHTPSVNLELVGFFQSWQYFQKVQMQVKTEFSPSQLVIQKALDFINAAKETYMATHNGMEPVVIGTHIRRGDMASDRFQKLGYTTVDLNYISSAMQHFQHKYKHTVFLICSDDIIWCEQTIRINKTGSSVVFSKHHDDITDLSILSQSDHLITSTGTFSWWAGWLSKGDVVYYKDFPRNGSKLSDMFSQYKMDYYRPGWKPM